MNRLSGLARLARSCALTAFLFGAGSGAFAQTTYTYFEAGGLGGGGGGAINRFGAIASAVGISFGVSHAAVWEDGVVTDLGTAYDSVFAFSAASGINDFGEVVGVGSVSPNENAALLFVNGKVIDLSIDLPNVSFSAADDINNRREIVGSYRKPAGSPSRGFLLRNGRFTDLGSLGGTGISEFDKTTAPYAINNKGRIVGLSKRQDGLVRAFLWEKGRMQDLGALGDGRFSIAEDINDNNVVVGRSQDDQDNIRAFVWRDGTMSNLGSLNGGSSSASAINNRGQVVGRTEFNGKPFLNAGHAALWENGLIIDLNTVVVNLPADTALETAYAINAEGIIFGSTCSLFCEPGKGSPQRGFILIPNVN